MCHNVEGTDLTGHPALSINCSTIDGLPVGLMIVAKHYDETRLFKVASKVEKMTH